MSWRAIPAIKSLQRDLDERYPNRTRPDWILGDADHSARASDHNPDSDGDVHAIDVRLGDGLIPEEVLNATVGDSRVKYVIYNYKIYSRTYGWEARRYNGSNPHTTHIHVSFRYEPRFENDESPWFQKRKRRTRPVPIDLSEVRHEFRKALDLEPGALKVSPHVRRLQRALNYKLGMELDVDGLVGRQTLRAWGCWERRRDVPGGGRNRIPDRQSLTALLEARWRMVE